MRGVNFIQQGQLDDAIRELKTAIKYEPFDYTTYYNLGCAYCRQGCIDEALQAYRTAVEINPTFKEARLSLGVRAQDIVNHFNSEKAQDIVNPRIAQTS